MGINKNFVVKNGFEVNTDLILADAITNKVGIGTTVLVYTLSVNGGIGVTDSYTTGVSTVRNKFQVGTGGTVFTVIGQSGNPQGVGVGTINPEYLLDVRSPVSTGQTALYVQGDVRITGDLNLDDISLDQANINRLFVTDTETNTLYVTGFSTFLNSLNIDSYVDISSDLNVVGLATLGNYVDINDSVDISSDLNVVGLTTLGNYVDINDSVDISSDLNVVGVTTLTTAYINAGDIAVSNVDTTDLNVTGISTLGTVLVSSGIVTATSVSGIVTYYGDGSYLTGNARNLTATIGLSTESGIVGYGVSLLDLRGAGVSTTFFDTSVGIATIFFEGGGSGTIGIGTEFPITPIPSNGDLFYNANYGRIFVYYDENIIGVGTDKYWIDAAPFNVGSLESLNLNNLTIDTLTVNNIGTVTKLQVGIPTTSTEELIVTGDARVTGILTIGTASITLDGTENAERINVGTGITITNSNISITGVITATSFVGDGSGLTGAGSTVSDDTTTNQTFYPLFTATTSGTVTDSKVSTSKLSFNPSTGSLSATQLINTRLVNYSEKVNTLGNTGSSATINIADGNFVTATLDQGTTFTFTAPGSNDVYGFSLLLTNGAGGPFTITWPTSVKWPGNTIPVRTTTDGKSDIWVFTTIDNGVNWYGYIAIYDFS